MNLKKWRAFIDSKWLEPRANRRKFGSLLFFLTIIVFSVFIVRFMYIVGAGKVGKTSLETKTQELYQGSSVVQAKRGTIYDRNGDAIAEDATSYSLYAVMDKKYLGLENPKTGKREKLYVEEKNKADIAKILAKYTKLEEKEILERLVPKKNKQGNLIKQVEFGYDGKKITLETKEKIEKELEKKGIKGIYFEKHPARMYPKGVFSPYIIGYASLADEDNDAKGLVGKMGIEKSYDKILAGTNGKIRYQKDRYQQPLPGTTVVEKETEDGKDIYTTLDAQLQSRLEDLMTQSYEEYGSEDITAILADAKTGSIVAASQRPAFNPEGLVGLDKGEDSPWLNLLIEQPYEPGSTMKVFTVAAAIETGVFKENDTFRTGSIQVEDKKINDHIPEGVGTITYRQALAWSSNVGMVHLQQMMDMRWVDYIKKFGFGESTESGLYGELPGTVNDKNVVDIAMSAYGQAIAVTPFQMIQAYTAISNDGKMMKPNYISKIVDQKGNETIKKPEMISKPIKASTAKKVREMMVDVTEDEVYGTGKKFYKIDGYHVAAKTGTAQIFENGGLVQDQYLYSVVQMAPADDPKYIMYVTMRKPPLGVVAEELISKISNPLLKRALDFDEGEAANKAKEASKEEAAKKEQTGD